MFDLCRGEFIEYEPQNPKTPKPHWSDLNLDDVSECLLSMMQNGRANFSSKALYVNSKCQATGL